MCCIVYRVVRRRYAHTHIRAVLAIDSLCRFSVFVDFASFNPVQFALVTVCFFMAALHSRCGHYIFALWFLLSSLLLSSLLLSSSCFSSPNLSRRRLDVYHTSTHGVALVRI